MLKAVLFRHNFSSSPRRGTESEDKILPLDDYQLSSRLSYLLWSAPPDAELAALADKAELQKPGTLKKQVERLLKDKRARALFDGFGAQWLRVNDLDGQVFDPKTFPQMTPALRNAMKEEARLFFESIVRENLSVSRFVDSDYTFLNEPLAKIYETSEPISGPKMRRVKLDNPNRGGILGMPATLAATSFPNRTSPVAESMGIGADSWRTRSFPHRPTSPNWKSRSTRKSRVDFGKRTELHQTSGLPQLSQRYSTRSASAWKISMPSDGGGTRTKRDSRSTPQASCRTVELSPRPPSSKTARQARKRIGPQLDRTLHGLRARPAVGWLRSSRNRSYSGERRQRRVRNPLHHFRVITSYLFTFRDQRILRITRNPNIP